jgi:hypothetical protein
MFPSRNFVENHENRLMFLNYMGKSSELEPEPEFLTSRSRSWSQTKMDRLRNTVNNLIQRSMFNFLNKFLDLTLVLILSQGLS